MDIKENFEIIKNLTLEFSSLMSHSQKNESHLNMNNLIEMIKSILESPKVQEDLNDNIFWLHKKNDNVYEYFVILLENLLGFIERNVDEKINTFQIIEIISLLRVKLVLKIKSSIFIRFLDLKPINKEEENGIWSIVFNLSENQIHDNVDFSDIDRNIILDKIDTITNSDFRGKIRKNFMEIPLSERLECLKELVLNEDMIENDENFLNTFQAISLELNKHKDRFMFSNLFLKYDSLRFFTNLFHLLIEVLDRNLHETHDKVFTFLKYLLEILIKIIRSHRGLEDEFLKEEIIHTFFKLFKNQNLVNLLFERDVNCLMKVIHVFTRFTRRLYLMKKANIQGEYFLSELNVPFDSLIATRHSLESLYDKTDKDVMMQKPLFRIYLRALAFIQVAFKPEISLLETKHYELIASLANASCFFKNERDDFIKYCDLVNYEFLNELNEIEVQKVYRFNIYNNRNRTDTNYYFIEIIIWLKEIFITPEQMEIAFVAYQNFFKSIIYFSLDIEKLICLNCIASFCAVEKIKKQIFDDTKFVEFIENVLFRNQKASNDTIQERLNLCIKSFLSFKSNV